MCPRNKDSWLSNLDARSWQNDHSWLKVKLKNPKRKHMDYLSSSQIIQVWKHPNPGNWSSDTRKLTCNSSTEEFMKNHIFPSKLQSAVAYCFKKIKLWNYQKCNTCWYEDEQDIKPESVLHKMKLVLLYRRNLIPNKDNSLWRQFRLERSCQMPNSLKNLRHNKVQYLIRTTSLYININI